MSLFCYFSHLFFFLAIILLLSAILNILLEASIFCSKFNVPEAYFAIFLTYVSYWQILNTST